MFGGTIVAFGPLISFSLNKKVSVKGKSPGKDVQVGVKVAASKMSSSRAV